MTPRRSGDHRHDQEACRFQSLLAILEDRGAQRDRRPGRWRNYEAQMAPWLDRLQPFAEAFGYEV